LFSPLGKLADRAIYFTFRNFFFLFFYASKAISVSTGLIFTIFFHQMEGISVNFLDPVQFFRFLKGRCHGNRFCEKIANTPRSSLWHSETE